MQGKSFFAGKRPVDKKRFRDRYYLVWLLTRTLGNLMSNVHVVSDDDIRTVIDHVQAILSAVELERIERNKELMR